MRTRVDRASLAASLVLAPALAAALLVVALEAGRLRQPDDPLFASPPPASLGQAVLDGDVEGAYALVRAGHDVNGLLEMPVPEAPARLASMTPLTLAVAARDANNVRMLLSAGADMSRPGNRLALCLARERDDRAMVGILEPLVPAGTPCPPRVFN